MSPAIKRKKELSNESFMRSRKTTEIDGPPSKRVRKEAPLVQTHKEDKGLKDVGSVTLQVTKIAGTKREEAAFPRGGASVLTPLEYKQIHIEATRDVLFEQQTASRKRETQDEEPAEPIVLKSTGKKRKSKNRGQEMTKKQRAEDELVKIDSLSYKVYPAFYS
jgi:rRNA biogenesis protein RRP5